MTIRKGQPWGERSPLPVGAPIASSDTQLAQLLHEQSAELSPPTVGLTGGEIWELLGGRGLAGRINSQDAWTFPIDIGVVTLDHGADIPFVSYVLGHRHVRSGFAVMNGQVAAKLRLGHRSHVNDGLLDVTEWSLRIGELWKVRSRSRTGSHMPHPRISERRVKDVTFEFRQPQRIRVDGRGYGSSRLIRIRIRPDAGFVVV